MRAPRWWQERTSAQRVTFAWSAVALCATLWRQARYERHPYVPDWRVAGVTPAGDSLLLDLSSVAHDSATYRVRLRPARPDSRQALVNVDCASRRVRWTDLHAELRPLSGRAVALVCAQGH